MAFQVQLPNLPVSYWALGFVAIFLYALSRAVYRLYFHPLKDFPGPKIAAITYWYEMYHDIFLDGQYIYKLKKLHKQYGPIIRISPEELHISDPHFYNTVFAPAALPETGQAPKRHKWIRWVSLAGHPEISFLGTTNHDKHKLRRRAMERFFSPAVVKNLAPTMILEKVETLCRRLGEEGRKGNVKIKLACSCYTTDVISDYAFGRSFDYLNHPTFFPEWSVIFVQIAKTSHLLKPWPFLFKILDSVPLWLAKKIGPGVAASVGSNRESRELIVALKEGKHKDVDRLKPRLHPSIFEEVLNSNLPPEEKSVDRLQGDGQAIIGAGTETTATVLATGIVSVLLNPDIESRLRKELQEAIPDPAILAPLPILEKLPYLTAVIRESLRTGYGVYGRISRISDLPISFGDYVIPPGTPIAMCSGIVHNDPSIFPEPEKFDPERWTDPAESARLYRYLVAFSKGPRMCIGINIAYAELYMAIAALFRRFNMELKNVHEGDLEVVKDWFVPCFKKDQNDFEISVTPIGE